MSNRNLRKERVGVVTSNKMDKTIVVTVETRVKHEKYGKFLKKTKKFMAHDEKEDSGIGDTVKIMEIRPMSKNKCWRLTEVLESSAIFLSANQAPKENLFFCRTLFTCQTFF